MRTGWALIVLLTGSTAACTGGATPTPSPTSTSGPAEAYLDAALGAE